MRSLFGRTGVRLLGYRTRTESSRCRPSDRSEFPRSLRSPRKRWFLGVCRRDGRPAVRYRRSAPTNIGRVEKTYPLDRRPAHLRTRLGRCTHLPDSGSNPSRCRELCMGRALEVPTGKHRGYSSGPLDCRFDSHSSCPHRGMRCLCLEDSSGRTVSLGRHSCCRSGHCLRRRARSLGSLRRRGAQQRQQVRRCIGFYPSSRALDVVHKRHLLPIGRACLPSVKDACDNRITARTVGAHPV
jgi:hypothetical protein